MHQTIEPFRAQLRAYFAKRLPQEADAEDLTQEVLLKWLAQWDQARQPELLGPWLFRVAANQLADFYRQRGRPLPEPEAPGAETENFNEEFSQCLLVMIESLPAPYAEALKAVEMEGRRQKDYAKDAGLSLSGAKSRVQRGRKLLKERLNDCCPAETDAYGNQLRPPTCGC